MSNVGLGYNVYLEDVVENTTTLLNTSTYTISPSADILGTGRFYLRFETDETLSVSESDLDEVLIYNDQNKKEIIVSDILNENTTLVLFDVQGREIIRKDLDTQNTLNAINTSGYANGVYVVQLISKTNTRSKKLVIR